MRKLGRQQRIKIFGIFKEMGSETEMPIEIGSLYRSLGTEKNPKEEYEQKQENRYENFISRTDFLPLMQKKLIHR